MCIISVDAMGGDFGSGVIITGVSQALQRFPEIKKILLVGNSEAMAPELERCGLTDSDRIEVIHTEQVVEMSESAATALRAKKKSSIAVAVDLVKQGRAQAVFSAGHTGAAVASTVVKLRSLPGIDRPAIAAVFPAPSGHFVLLDAGANVDSKPLNLIQFAIMGETYARHILGVEKPRIGLLNVGAENGKGNELTKGAFAMFENLTGSGVNFIGNVEGHDFFRGSVDVVVCDGFVGNAILKSCESLAKTFTAMLKQFLRRNLIRIAGALLCRNAFKDMRSLSDPDEYGGAPLLGVNGICIIGHGSASAIAVENGIRVAMEFIRHQINDKISMRLQELGMSCAAVEAAEQPGGSVEQEADPIT